MKKLSLLVILLLLAGLIPFSAGAAHPPTTVHASEPPTTVYVNAAWADLPPGTDPDAAGPALAMELDAFATIQAGVSAVAPGGTVNVAPGIYVETITITTPLTLQGAPGAVIKPDDNTPLVSGAGRIAIYIASTPGVTVDSFEIDGTGGEDHVGVYAFNADGTTLRNLSIHHIQNPKANAVGGGIQVQGLGKGPSNVTIENNVIDDTGRIAIWVGGSQTAPPYKYAPAENIVIRGNVVRRAWQGVTIYTGGAIEVVGAAGSLIADNEVSQTGNGSYGIYLSGTAGTPTLVTGNKVFDNPSGIVVWTNLFIVDYSALPATAPLVHSNSLYDNRDYGLRSLDSDPTYTVDATLNWWGSRLGPTHPANPGGNGQAAGGNVTYQPWLCSGTDADPDQTGFQPAFTQVCPGQPPAALVFATQPVGAIYNRPLATQPVVHVVDADGNPLVGFTGEITLTLQGGTAGAVLGGSVTVSAVDGEATFDGLSVDLPGMGVHAGRDQRGADGHQRIVRRP